MYVVYITLYVGYSLLNSFFVPVLGVEFKNV